MNAWTDERIWRVGFMRYDLGYFGLEQKTLQPLDKTFGTRLSPMSWVRSSWVRSVTHESGPDMRKMVAGEGHATTSLLAAKSNEFNSLIAKGARI
jgi:hypothetical protein